MINCRKRFSPLIVFFATRNKVQSNVLKLLRAQSKKQHHENESTIS